MMSCLSLMPVSSENAFASVCDSYSWVVMVSETTLISMPLNGSAAFANHSSSFFWSSFDSVEGWNSAIHFWITASSAARTGAETANDTATSAATLDMVRKLFLVNGPFLLLNCRMLFLRLQRQTLQARVGPGSGLLRELQTVRKMNTAVTSEITVASHRLETSKPSSPTGNVAMASVPTRPIHSR